MQTTSSKKGSRSHVIAWLLLGVMVLGLLLRCHHLGRGSLWGDEGTTAWTAALPLPEMFNTIERIERTLPLHMLCMHVWIGAFGDSEVAVRIPSVLFGVASIAVLYFLARSLFDRRTGIVAAVLLAVNPYHIAYSREARFYSLLVFLALCSLCLFERLMRPRATFWHRAGYVLVLAAMLYTHLYGMFVILAQILTWAMACVLCEHKPALTWKWALGLWVSAALLLSPWLLVVSRWVHEVHAGGFWIPWVGWRVIYDAMVRYADNTPLLFLFVACMVWAMRRHTWRHWGIILGLCLMFCCVLVPVFLSRFWRPCFIPRYGIMATVGMCLLASACAVGRRRISVSVAILFCLLSLPDAIHIENVEEWKTVEWRLLVETIRQNASLGDSIVIDNGYYDYVFAYYFRHPEQYTPGGNRITPDGLYQRNPKAHIWLALINSDHPLEYYLDLAGPQYYVARQEPYALCNLFELRPKPVDVAAGR